MKNVLQSKSTFQAFIEIDFSYFALSEIQKKLNEQAPKNGFERAIDEATGYAKSQTEKYKKDAIGLIKCIIKNKKKINADYSNDEKTLEGLLSLS